LTTGAAWLNVETAFLFQIYFRQPSLHLTLQYHLNLQDTTVFA